MIKEALLKYRRCGDFSFEATESLKEKCNAPTTHGGVYLIYRDAETDESLLYIGSSGQRGADGGLKVRKSGLGGMKDRIVNGHHPKFGKVPRRKAFPEQMRREGISELRILWWVTYNVHHQDFPTDVEQNVTDAYRAEYGRFPTWHA